MLGLLRVGAGDEHAPVGQVGERVPHLLAVDDPFLAVLHGLRAEAGEVAARAGLAEQLAPALLAGEHRAQEAALLLVAAVGDDGGAGERDEERARVLRGGAGLAAALLDDAVEVGRHTEATEALGEVHPRQAGVVAVAPELDVAALRGRVLLEEAVDGFVDAVGVAHARQSRRGRRSGSIRSVGDGRRGWTSGEGRQRGIGRTWLRLTTFMASCDVRVWTNGRPARRSM